MGDPATVVKHRCLPQSDLRMDPGTKQQLRTAAAEARRRYPGAVGELLSQELLSWMVFGHLLGSTLILRVADDLTDTPHDGAQWAASSQLRP